jgi:hypothetical protein
MPVTDGGDYRRSDFIRVRSTNLLDSIRSSFTRAVALPSFTPSLCRAGKTSEDAFPLPHIWFSAGLARFDGDADHQSDIPVILRH